MFHLLLLFFCSLMIAGARQVWLLHAKIFSRLPMVFSGRGVSGKIPLVYLAVFAGVWQWGALPCDRFRGLPLLILLWFMCCQGRVSILPFPMMGMFIWCTAPPGTIR